MKTKYIKVPTAERLPYKEGYYFTFRDDFGESITSLFNGNWHLPKDTIHRVEYWLEEIPDREDEMKKVLERVELLLNEFHNDLAKSIVDMKTYSPLSKQLLEIKRLLNKQ
ncbi:hypothetical protein ATE47_04075 [Chryseobacterium sp. IHB B 17019]|uniref:hypothetical protein n=1 Tax=Chryseobacterium sp. IHB B 17019 TaxID=1721091 RepID=UPI000722E51F|nr:hypothetical protein [Chryseobacterium sp. IHB B 17019]ALR29747.1 hypothetical protein ATE47_04075 [Chryseobacterium sp. IHB B 17019]